MGKKSVRYCCIKHQTWIVYSPSECCLLEPTNEDSYIYRKFKYEHDMLNMIERSDEENDFEDE